MFVVYNPSDSVPRGWYRIGRMESAASLHVGSIVLARLPAGVAAFAARRGYLQSGVPILKRIGALVPQSVCVCDQLVRIDGTAIGRRAASFIIDRAEGRAVVQKVVDLGFRVVERGSS